ncbi:DnaJ domain-containing protein [Xylogone sp. PMI_703]|nr:DnaJ domain-containing protein [Xylogone sp. PMI_703]
MAPRKEEEEDDDMMDNEPPVIEPYTVLGIDKTATPDEIKSAYRKAALRHHPDKAPEHLKGEAHTKFQEVAFAYAVLSDPVRRKRYDTTGSTSESIVDADGFSWTEFYQDQFKNAVTEEAIAQFSKKYKGSDDEKDDILEAYTQSKGKMDAIYETVMLSNPLDDDERFRKIIDAAIADGSVRSYKAYTHESAASKRARVEEAKGEAEEAMAYAKELGVEDKLFGKKGKGGKKHNDEADLAALIQSRAASRGSFLDALEEKYAPKGKASKSKSQKGKKRASDDDEESGMPSEEAFQKAAERLKKNKEEEGKAGGERKSKRTKR